MTGVSRERLPRSPRSAIRPAVTVRDQLLLGLLGFTVTGSALFALHDIPSGGRYAPSIMAATAA